MQDDKRTPFPIFHMPHRTGWIIALITLLALVIRIWVAWDAYRAPYDVPHFIEDAIRLLGGDMKGLNPHWSLGGILTAAIALRWGFEPDLWLQIVTVLTGTGLVWAIMMMVLRLTGNRAAALLTGAITAVNPTMIEFSVNSMGEMPYLFFLVFSIVCFLPPHDQPDTPRWRFPAASAVLGVGMFYRPVECFIAFVILAGWQILRTRKEGLPMLRPLLLGALFFSIFVAPHPLLTKRQYDTLSLSSKIVISLAAGSVGTDSKALYALEPPRRDHVEHLRERGILSYLWVNRREIAGNYTRNMTGAFRISKDQLFPAGFRVGTGWAFGFFLLAALLLHRPPWRSLLIAGVVFSVSLPSLLSLSFIHPRWLVNILPFTLAMGTATIYLIFQRTQARSVRVLATALLAAFMINATLYAKHTSGDGWYGHNQQAVGEQMRRFASHDAIIVSTDPKIALGFYGTHPFRWRSMRYGPIEDVLAFAARQNADLFVVASNILPHWPIQELFEGAPVPDGWIILDHVVYERYNPRWGYQTDAYLVLGRAQETEETVEP